MLLLTGSQELLETILILLKTFRAMLLFLTPIISLNFKAKKEKSC